MKKLFLLLLIFFIQGQGWSQINLITKFEQTEGKETVSYEEGIAYLTMLDDRFDCIKLVSQGNTDGGLPLHTAILSLNRSFNPDSLQSQGKLIVMINNNIHAGEPDGVDASLMLMRDIAIQTRQEPRSKLVKMMQDVVLVIVPFYNIEGVRNRNTSSRVNQNGPKSYGFRGNGRNYDLNRDFIKTDTENAKTFIRIFQQWNPDIYIENHTTNGADYQHIITYLSTQPDKLGGVLGEYMRNELSPKIEQEMKKDNFQVCPYVTAFDNTPDNGYSGFLDSPRYSIGYTSLFGTISYIVEAHMLKPFKERVEGTYKFMENTLSLASKDIINIKKLRVQYLQNIKTQKEFNLQWKNDEKLFDSINFNGYKATTIPSKVTTGNRLYYDRKQPYTKKIPFFGYFKPKLTIQKPKAYIIPKSWHNIVDKLKANNVKCDTFLKDTLLKIQAYYIKEFETIPKPFEGHYLHSKVVLDTISQEILFEKGDYLIYTNQTNNRYIIETLEPQGIDSFFAWNFFDSILQQKEHYSSYIFEDVALKLLQENPKLKEVFENEKAKNIQFSKDAEAQLDFIYKKSTHYEKTYNRYPIFRLLN